MKKINLERDFSNTIRLFKNYFSDIIPFFGFILGITVINQLIILFSVSLGFFSFIDKSELNFLVENFNAREFMEIINFLNQEVFLIVFVLLGFLIAFFVSLIGFSAIYGGILNLIRDVHEKNSPGIKSGLLGSKKFYKRISLLYLLLIIAIIVFLSPSFFLINISSFISVIYLMFSSFMVFLMYLLFFSFAKEAMVYDDLSIMDSLKKSFKFVKTNKLEIIFYFILFGIATLIIGGINLVFSSFFNTTMRGLTNALMIFLIYPFFVILKMNMYVDSISVISEIEIKSSYINEIKNGFVKSRNELVSFTKQNYLLIVFSFLILFIGGVGGKYLGDYLPVIELPQLNGGGFSSMIFLHLLFHNLTTAVGILFSGALFGIPTIGSLLFNGIVIGLVSTYVPSLEVFLISILPHGIIEIPALCIAGGLGIKLGKSVFNYFNKEKNLNYLEEEIKDVFFAVIGTIPLFLLAALIEALITPLFISTFTNFGV